MKQSSKNDIMNDRFVQDIVKKDYDQPPEAPLSKETVWERINADLTEQQVSNWFSRRINNKMLSVASILVILIISSLFFHIKDGEAFGWFTDYFVTKQGSTTQVTNQLSDEPIEAEDLPPVPSKDEIEVKELIPLEESMSFEEAKEVVTFSLLKPTYVPDGYILSDVTVITFNDHPQEEVILSYQSEEEIVTIGQEPIMGEQFSANITVNNEDAVVSTIDVNGQEATYFAFNDGVAQLVWMRMRTLITIEGSLGQSEMQKVASTLQ
ncbi:DUF4367 domain-containing protein [Paraliobacillus sp. X-1268]|uniref:DUF4367 domain-containing protein n=1 Tax=Paraliobacillus sp. X-1268 TaxID=2213193 RepID=UPI000E3C68D2|nr:DUF4367 domain-containing protein [Paraliobacillus sp. X-1268]